MKPVFIPSPLIDWVQLCVHVDPLYLDPIDKVCWNTLSKNPKAMLLLEEHMDKQLNTINWYFLSCNPNVFYLFNKPHLYEKCKHLIHWSVMCDLPNCIPFLEKHLDKVQWHWLCQNPNAIPFLEKHPENIQWYFLSSNPNAIHLLEQNPDKIHWARLCKNPNAIHLLDARIDKWDWISMDLIDWEWICLNPNALPLLEKHPEKNHMGFGLRQSCALTPL